MGSIMCRKKILSFVLLFALIFTVACSSGSEMEIRADRSVLDFGQEATFSTSVQVEDRTLVFTADDFSDEEMGLPKTQHFDVPDSDVLLIEATVESSDETVAEGTAEISLRPNFE